MFRLGSKLGLAAAFAVLNLFAGEANALFLVQVNSTLNAPASGSVTVGGSTVTLAKFTDNPSDVDLSVVGTPVHQTYGSTSVTSTSTTPDLFSVPYQWTLTFTHIVGGVATGATATLSNVTGTISGALTKNGSTLTNVYTGNPTETSPVTIVVDGRSIVVKLDAYTPPGTPPSTTNDFSVSLQASVPEPTTMALMGVGGLLLLAPYLRRKARTNADVS